MRRRRAWTLVPLVMLVSLGVGPAPGGAQTAGPTLAVDASADRHAISPDIYGMNLAAPALAAELRIGVNRWGGNSTTRYNWQTGVTSLARDWFFENYPFQSHNAFVGTNQNSGVASFISIPTMGLVAKPGSPLDHPLACGFKVSKYGPQEAVDQYDTDCGNGKHPDGTLITGNDPADTSVAAAAAFMRDWVADLVGRFGTASAGGVRYYGLDNEPVLWSDTHRDVHPATTTYDELRDKSVAVATAIKAADPTAAVAGPSDWGWLAYFDTLTPGDKAAHGNVDLAPWFLQQMKAYADAHGGQRILDYFDEHYYPQADGVTLSPAGSVATQALRLRSTRSLWDPTYLDESWIGDCCDGHVALIPRMRDWVAGNYPGTKVAIGEYNWGGLEAVNGALAQADVLGIFARERVDMAEIWDPPAPAEPGAFAFRMYRNYDGRGGSFGNTWVRSTSSDQAKLAVYGAVRGADGALTVMVVNKTGGGLMSPLNLTGIAPGAVAKVFRYSGANLAAIQHRADQPVSATSLTVTYPASSITLLVIPRAGGSTHRVGDFTGDGRTDVGVFRPSTGQWFVRSGAPELTVWGTGGDIPVPGDYDGNGSADAAVFRPSNGIWYVRGPSPSATPWGVNGDVPVPGDYDGDGTTDLAVYRPSTGAWYVKGPSPSVTLWGASGDVPVPADYDGNGTTDLAVFRPSTGAWYIRGGAPPIVVWGAAGDVPVPGDYDGNGSVDVAVWRPSSGLWFVAGPSPSATAWGVSGDVPVPGDYDGNGTADLAVWRPSTSQWYVRGGGPVVHYGVAGDVALPLAPAVARAFFP